MSVKRRVAVLLDLLVPARCAACDLPGEVICRACLAALPTVGAPGCLRCGHPWAVSTPTCSECPRHLNALRFAVPYVEPMPRLMGQLKDRGRRQLVVPLVDQVVARCAPACGEVLVPVPLTQARRSERGFNQAELLALGLAEAWGADVQRLLVRTRDDRPQRGASVTDRRTNVRGAFAVVPGDPPSEVWLVDDVCTTGATLSACALALRRAGVRSVGAVCLARVLRQPMRSTIEGQGQHARGGSHGSSRQREKHPRDGRVV
jgi:ComF family protein